MRTPSSLALLGDLELRWASGTRAGIEFPGVPAAAAALEACSNLDGSRRVNGQVLRCSQSSSEPPKRIALIDP